MIQIQKVRAKKQFNGIDVEYLESTDKGFKEVKASFGFKPMSSLIRSFSVLIPHLIISAESTEAELSELNAMIQDAEKDPICSRHKVKGFTITRKGDYVGVTLVGGKTLSTGSVVNFNSPMIQIQIEDGEELENAYAHNEELTEDVNNALAEIEAYIGGNYTSLSQGELDFSKKEDDEDKSDEPDELVKMTIDKKLSGTASKKHNLTSAAS